MPSKKKKYNARFPAGRIKKIMQMDDDVGKIAHAVPVVISRSIELFINSLLQHTANITKERNAKTLSLTHTKLCILKEQKFGFLKDLVKNIEDVSPEEEKSETSKQTKEEKRPSKRRCSDSERNLNLPISENCNEIQSAVSTSNSCSISYRFNQSENSQSNSDSPSSYDLVINED